MTMYCMYCKHGMYENKVAYKLQNLLLPKTGWMSKNSYLEWILDSKKDLFSPSHRWGETASLAPTPQS